ncbi:MAG: histidine phosphatase family protein [Candidatus Babeliales bacterium]|jgi:probable phosphoglycerate mutase
MMRNFKKSRAFVLIGFILSFMPLCGVTEFYFVRHGQTDHNIGLVKKNLDVPLNQVGLQQATMVKSYIAKLPIKTICYSPLKRAKQTKDIINAGLGIPEVKIPELAEGTGDFFSELQSVKSKQMPISKNLKKFLKRVTKGLRKALQYPAPVLIVAHGGVYSALCRILNIDSDEWVVANCTLMHFYKNRDGNWSVNHLFDVGTGRIFDLSYEQRQRVRPIILA